MRLYRTVWIWLLLSLVATGPALAHEVRPGFLELRQLDAETYDVLWKVPARGDRRLALYVRLPDDCSGTEPATRFVGGAYIERWRSNCAGGLEGHDIAIDGLAATRTDVLARIQRLDAGEDNYGFHRSAQHHAGGGDLGMDRCAVTAGRGRDRPQYRFRRGRSGEAAPG